MLHGITDYGSIKTEDELKNILISFHHNSNKFIIIVLVRNHLISSEESKFSTVK